MQIDFTNRLVWLVTEIDFGVPRTRNCARGFWLDFFLLYAVTVNSPSHPCIVNILLSASTHFHYSESGATRTWNVSVLQINVLKSVIDNLLVIFFFVCLILCTQLTHSKSNECQDGVCILI